MLPMLSRSSSLILGPTFWYHGVSPTDPRGRAGIPAPPSRVVWGSASTGAHTGTHLLRDPPPTHRHRRGGGREAVFTAKNAPNHWDMPVSDESKSA